MVNAQAKARADVRIQRVAMMLCHHAGLTIERNLATLFPAFHQAIHAVRVDMIVLPTSAGLPFARRWAEPLVREARTDLLLLAGTCPSSFELAFARWRPGLIDWDYPLHLCMSPLGEVRFVLPMAGEAERARTIHLADAVLRTVVESLPNESDLEEGFSRADRWLAEAFAVGSSA